MYHTVTTLTHRIMWSGRGALLLRRDAAAALVRAVRLRIQIVAEQRKQSAHALAVARPMAVDLIAFDGLARWLLRLRRPAGVLEQRLRSLRGGRRERFGRLHGQR